MIVVKLQGGLGNQLFQWSCGLSLSKKYKKDFYLDISFYGNQSGVTPRNFSLKEFSNLDDTNLKIFNGNYDNFTRLLDNFVHQNINCNQKDNYYLDGFWQSEKYFIEIESIIKDCLKPNEIFFNKTKDFDFSNKNYTSIHVRRGDYVRLQHYHPLQSIEYYKNSVDEIGNNDGLLIFSDDINWCRDNFNFPNMKFIEGYSDVENIWLMSLCKNNIIANSSFSWWGAWLNENKQKKIISPKIWFGERCGTITSSDIIPNNWIKI